MKNSAVYYIVVEIGADIICGDAYEVLKTIPDESVQTIITSPPYWSQRDYGVQGIGSEPGIDAYIEALLRIFGECLRCLRHDGNMFVNLGDKVVDGHLQLIPFRFAIAMCERYPVRLPNMITWVKTNPRPIRFNKRLVQSTEPIFHFVKSDHYLFFPEEYQPVRKGIPPVYGGDRRQVETITERKGESYRKAIETSPDLTEEEKQEAHEALDQLLAELRRGEIVDFRFRIKGVHPLLFDPGKKGKRARLEKKPFIIVRDRGIAPKRDIIVCGVGSNHGIDHPATYPEYLVEQLILLTTRPGDLVLDPFVGSGTTSVVAKRLGRRSIGIDLNPRYCELARQRLAGVQAQLSLPTPDTE